MTRQKEIERWFLKTARKADSIIPDGVIEECEKPDFKVHTAHGLLGVEVTEVLRRGNGPLTPVEASSLHNEMVRRAEADYYSSPDAIPVRVYVGFWNPEGQRLDKRDMVGKLVAFVRSHAMHATPLALFESLDCPEGFSVIQIDSRKERWSTDDCGGPTLSEIFDQLAFRIRSKNELLPAYRASPPSSPIWLLVYSGFAVARGLSIPHGIENWTVPFDFEKVLFFSQLSGQVVEIQRTNL